MRRFLAPLAALLMLAGPVLAQDKPAAPPAPAPTEPAAPPPIFTPKPQEKQSSPFPFGRTFVAVRYKDQLFKDDRPTIVVGREFRGNGFGACNNWSATIIPRADQRMAVGPIATTRRSCGERLDHNEKVFLFVLQTSQSWIFDGRVLTLDGPYGPLSFEPAV